MSSQTTEILFNSPALHSLKRDQLVKLCKIHSIKASGKNVEIIERLKKVAEGLPKGAPLSIAARSDAPAGDDGMDIDGEEDKENLYAIQSQQSMMKTLPRPSEQWEVMESIAECDSEDSGSRQGTLTSLGSNREFGTGSSKSSTVSSSIKALASSLGLKRSTSAKSALSTSTSFTAATGTTYNTSTLISSFPEPPPPVPSLPSSSSLDTLSVLSPRTRGSRPRTVIEDELTKHATPYTNIPAPSPSQMPQTDHFSDFTHYSAQPPTPRTLSKFDFANTQESAPLPGHVLRPGAPAPENARLSMGDTRLSFGIGLGSPRKSTEAGKSGPTTTIRLVSSSSTTCASDDTAPATPPNPFDFSRITPGTPQLKPLNTTFDLVLGSPAGNGHGDNVKIYPDLPMENVVQSPSRPGSTAPLNLSPPKQSSSSSSDPFVFGSPLPQHRVSNAQFQNAAASVLAEMNQRLLAEGVDTVGTSLISNLRPGAGVDLTPNTKKIYANREIKPLRNSFGANTAKREVKEKFERAHKDHFEGMESIASYLHRKSNSVAGGSMTSKAQVSSAAQNDDEPVQLGKKRKSNVLGETRQGPAQTKRPSTRVISNTRRKIPGGFGDDDDDEEEEETQAPAGKKARVEFSGSGDASARFAEDAGETAQDDVAGERTEKEREAIRRRLEMNRQRRRSSAANGRVSMGRGRVSAGRKSLLHKPPPKPIAAKSRFGFISTAAKSIVKGVWGGVGGSKKTASAPTAKSESVTTAPSSKSAAAAPKISSGALPKAKMGPPSSVQSKVSTSGAGPSLRVPSTSTRASHSRSPSATGTVTSLSSVGTTTSARSRSPLPSFAAPTRSSSVRTSTTGTASTRTSSVASRVGGTGTSRVSTTSSGASSRVSSLGTRGSLLNSTPSSTSSRLLAPTASSLAKTSGTSKLRSGALNVPSGLPRESSPSTIPEDTNAPPKPASGKIFSKPLVVPVGSGLPSPVRSGNSQTVTQGGGAGAGVSRQRSLAGRKPRISRSKVIAKLASQRVASGSGSASTAGSSAVGAAAKRSSLGVGVHKAPRKSVGGARRSHVGVSGSRSSETSVLLSAKKRARQSEYARRRSRAAGASIGGAGAGASGAAMDVDA